MKIILWMALFFLFFNLDSAQGDIRSRSQSMNQIAEDSGAICLARLASFEPSSEPSDERVRPPLLPAATYNFKIVCRIKGDLPNDVKLDSQPLDRYSYGFSEFKVAPGDLFLLFLKTSPIEPLDKDLPFIHLPNSNEEKIIDFCNKNKEQSPVFVIANILSLSLKDGKEANSLLYFLSRTKSQSVIVAASAFIKSNDLKIRDYALSALAENQQVRAIPEIASLAQENPYGTSSVIKIGEYDVEEAVPYLQPLIIGSLSRLRLNAAIALNKVQNRSSIPYLMLALWDTDSQKLIPRYADGTLHDLIPELGNIYEAGNIQTNPEAEKRKVISWWQGELSGKHPAAPDEKPAVELRQAQRFEAKDLPQLNQGLFMKSEITRRAAIRGLGQFADQSSIPYLLIALYDPQPEIAYGAYTILHHLVPDLGAASASKWKNEREVQAKLAFDWWQKHLIDAEKKQLAP